MSNDNWNKRYAQADQLWSGDPHPQLTDLVAGLRPGTALEVACGEGADAVWLAEQGWDVVAVDFSDVAIERARRAAQERGLSIQFLVGDLADWTPPSSFDLIVEFYLHMDPDRRVGLHRRLAEHLTVGGHMAVVGHHPDHVGPDRPGPPRENCFTPIDIQQDFNGLTPIRAERVETETDDHAAVDTIYLGQRAGD